MKSEWQRHIAIEGCVGVGKTTLAERLSTFRHARLVLEAFENNPFLEQFYENPTSNVLENSLQFLLLHCHQIRQMRKIWCTETITDFSFFKDGIFAEINLLDQVERELFGKACDLLHAKLPAPDLVIYIRGSNSLVFERIRQRNRLMEGGTDNSYFAKINEAYEKFFSGFTGNVHIIEADIYDCLNDPAYVPSLSKTMDDIFVRQSGALI
jgi:deoxyguanosine kinase